MTEAREDVTVRDLHPIPPWAHDPQSRPVGWNDPSFGIVVQPLMPDHKFDIAPLGETMNAIVARVLNSHGRFGEFCDVKLPPGHQGAMCNLEVQRGTGIIRDKDTGLLFQLHRYIPSFARDPRRVFNNNGDTICGVQVHALEPGHEYDAAPLGRQMSMNVEETLNSPGEFGAFCDVQVLNRGQGAGCHLAVQRGGNILRDKDTGLEYRLQSYVPEFHVHRIPNWAERQCDFFKSELGKKMGHFVGILVKVQDETGETHEEVAVPKAASGQDLMALLDEMALENTWVSFNCEGGVVLEFNAFRSLIKEQNGSRRIYKMKHVIAPVRLSDPYNASKTDLFGTNEFTFKHGGVEETVILNEENVREHVHHRFATVLDTNDMEGMKEVYCDETTARASPHDGSHGEFMWIYEYLVRNQSPESSVHSFTAKAYDSSISEGLERAKMNGESSFSFKLMIQHYPGKEEEVEYEVDISTDWMMQRQKYSPYRQRRVWRVGTEFKKELESYWMLTQKISDVSASVPRYWTKDDGSHIVKMESEEGKYILKMIESSIQGYEHNPHTKTEFGENWGNSEDEDKRDSAGNTVHFIDEKGQTKTEKPKAVHVAAILRIQKQAQYTNFRMYQSKLASIHGSALSNEPESKYMSEAPMATGETTDKRVNEVWGFSCAHPIVASQLIMNRIAINVRSSNPENTFGRGLYFTDSFVNTVNYCRCPICKGGQYLGGVFHECVCNERNLTHPRIVFLSRITMGKPLIIRDVPQYLMHSHEKNGIGFPTNGYCLAII